jgi:hypothetical protein
MSFMDFKVDTSNHSGLDYETYKSKMKTFAMTKPAEYADMRIEVIEKLKKEAMKDIYKTFYMLLTEGQTKDGKAILTNGDWVAKFKPNMNYQQVSEIALGAVKTYHKMIDDALEDVIPDYLDKLAGSVVKKQADAELFK